MGSNNHLVNRIPWNVLDEALELKENNGKFKIYVSEKNKKKLQYFAHRMIAILEEFVETDQSKVEDLIKYDPTNWGDHVVRGGYGHLGYLDSLVSSYIQLNLLLLNWTKYQHVIRTNNNWAFNCCAGEHDGAHPDWLATLFQRIYKKMGETFHTYQFQDLSNETITYIQEHNKIFFRCLYTYLKQHPNPNPNRNRDPRTVLDAESILYDIEWIFSL